MIESFREHREVVLGGGTFLLGVWIAANGITVVGVVWGVALFLGIIKLGGKLSWGLVLGGLLFFGMWRYEVALPIFDENDAAFYHSEIEAVSFEGVVVDYPDVRSDRIKLTMEAVELNGREVSGRVLMTVFRYPEFEYGERLRFYGLLQEPTEFDSFSYKNYLRRYGIDSVMYYPWVEVLDGPRRAGMGWRRLDWRQPIFGLKTQVEERLNQLFVEPHASFAAGLLLGSRRGIPEDLMEDFNISGLTHIIAISGYNITLIIVFVSGLLQFLSKRWQTIMATLVIIVFVILVGGTAAVVRSAIMGVLGLWAVWFGRKAEVTRLLVLSALFMTLWNPFILVDDVGFQLSFAATCGLVYMTDSVQRFLKWLRVWKFIPEVLSIREAFQTTLAAQTFAVPIIIGAFERFSLVAPFANVAAVSFIPLAMLFSFVALLVSYVWWSGGLLIAYIGWFFLELIMQIAHWSAQVPGSSIDFQRFL